MPAACHGAIGGNHITPRLWGEATRPLCKVSSVTSRSCRLETIEGRQKAETKTASKTASPSALMLGGCDALALSQPSERAHASLYMADRILQKTCAVVN